MKSLATLIKLQKTRVDEQRVMVARLQEKADALAANIRQLEEQKAREQKAAREKPEQAITYGNFIKEAIKRGKILERERQIAEAAVNAARATLAELFEEQKRYEIAEENRVEEERRTAKRKETLALDEIGGVTHQRKKSS